MSRFVTYMYFDSFPNPIMSEYFFSFFFKNVSCPKNVSACDINVICSTLHFYCFGRCVNFMLAIVIVNVVFYKVFPNAHIINVQ